MMLTKYASIFQFFFSSHFRIIIESYIKGMHKFFFSFFVVGGQLKVNKKKKNVKKENLI